MSITNKKWRLNNLYRIIDKDGNSIPFRLNRVQEYVLDNKHTRNLILKARQMGLSTYCVLDIMDDALWTEHQNEGIVSYSVEHAKHIFKKMIGHALDTLHPDIKSLVGITTHTQREIALDNGSSLRVDTTLRGGTVFNCLVSEFGKTCARNPQKAEEVVTGTIQAVPINGNLTIESTLEGNDGYFAEMVLAAHQRGNENLNPLEYKLFFFPWYEEPSYSLEMTTIIAGEMIDYFINLEKKTGVKFTEGQKSWYQTQWRLLGPKMKKEYPSTIEECFESSSEALYFAEAIDRAYKDNRVLYSSLYDSLLPVYVAMDVGLNDLTVIIFFQIAHGEIRILDYYEDSNKDVPFYAKFLLQDKPYLYNTIFLPHDTKKRDPLDAANSYERDFRRLFQNVPTKFVVLPRKEKQLQISHARVTLNRCVFNANKTKPLIDQLRKYRKQWNEGIGRYTDDPYHNDASHYADAFQYLCQGVSHIEAVGNVTGSMDKHRAAVAARNKMI